MDVILAVIVIGGLYPASLAAFIIQFARLRSDMHAGFDRIDTRFDRLDTRFDRLEAQLDGGFDRLDSGFGGLEEKVNDLIATPDRNERLTDLDGSGADD